MAARTSRRLLDAPLSGGADTLDDAYAVQREVTSLRLGRGERVVGWKLGYTSRAMREQMGVAEPNLGPLTDVMLLAGTSRGAGGRPAVVPGAAVQPRVEPEIALRLGRPLAPGCTVDDVLDACRGAGAGQDASGAGAFGCLEVVDSVWSGYRFRLEDNTSDGSSAGWVVLGDRLPLDDLPAVGVRLLVDDVCVAEATGAAAGGHPASGVTWLANEVGRRYGRRLEAGDVVITGGLTAAHPLLPGGVVSAVFAPGPPGRDVRVAATLDR
ncbi:MAG: 2-keto-4-pentenoate hydratase [Kineosporiaceae bacterium]